jgi:transcriptional/translational regulatory protein YebC/TACO1
MQSRVISTIFLLNGTDIPENMTKDAINRAIARGEPKAMGSNVSSVTYEVMLSGGVALVM